jgi:hypothetical protein
VSGSCFLRPALALSAALFAVSSYAAAPNPAARLSALSLPDCTGPANMLAEDAAAPANATFMRVQHIGDPGTDELAREIANAVTWDVGALTGFHAPAGSQRGYRDVGLPVGTSAFQLDCGTAGFLINTWQFSHKVALVGEGPSVSIGRDLVPAPKIFDGAKAMVLEARIAIPWTHAESPPISDGTAQVSFFYYARDSSRGTVFAHVIALFDNRGAGLAGHESIGSDGVTAFAGSPLSPYDANGNAVRYVSVGAASALMHFESGFAEPKFFQAIVTHENFRSMLVRLASESMPGISTRPEDYEIAFFGVLGEVFPGTSDSHNVDLGASVRELALYRDPLRKTMRASSGR